MLMFNKKNRQSQKKIVSCANKQGSAMILTMFILAGMLIVAFGGAYLILLGLRAIGTQYQSTRAYYAAEAGAEEVLYNLRKGGWVYGEPSADPVFEGEVTFAQGGISAAPAGYKVYFLGGAPIRLIFHSIGECQSTKRSIEVQI